MADDEEIIKINVEGKKEEHTPKMEHKSKEKTFLKNIWFWQLLSFVLIILFIISLFNLFSDNAISKAEARQKVQKYIDTILQRQEITALIGDPVEEKGLYKIQVTLEGQAMDTYVTKDGVLFFPNSIDLDKFAELIDSAGSLGVPVQPGVNEVEVTPEMIENAPEETSDEVVAEDTTEII